MTDDGGDAHGGGVYELRRGHRRLLVEVGNVGDRERVLVFLDDQLVGTGLVDEGSARIEVDSRNGDEVPLLTRESVLEVLDASNFDVLLRACEQEDEEFVHEFKLYATDVDPMAQGGGVYRERGDFRKLVIEVEQVSSTDQLAVYIDDHLAGELVIEEGAGRIELNTELGHEVPRVTKETLVRLKKPGTGDVVLSSVRPDEHDDLLILEFKLFGTDADPQAQGYALYKENFTKGDVRKFVVELEHVSAADGVLIFVDGVLIDDLALVEGIGRLHLDTRDGHVVPVLTEMSVDRRRTPRNRNGASHQRS